VAFYLTNSIRFFEVVDFGIVEIHVDRFDAGLDVVDAYQSVASRSDTDRARNPCARGLQGMAPIPSRS